MATRTTQENSGKTYRRPQSLMLDHPRTSMHETKRFIENLRLSLNHIRSNPGELAQATLEVNTGRMRNSHTSDVVPTLNRIISRGQSNIGQSHRINIILKGLKRAFYMWLCWTSWGVLQRALSSLILFHETFLLHRDLNHMRAGRSFCSSRIGSEIAYHVSRVGQLFDNDERRQGRIRVAALAADGKDGASHEWNCRFQRVALRCRCYRSCVGVLSLRLWEPSWFEWVR